MSNNIFIKIITIIILFGGVLLLYSHFIGTKGLFIREYSVKKETLPSNFEGFKVVHFSDLHYGSTIKEKEINKLVDTINALKPDLVFFTGDLIEENYKLSEKEQNALVESLKKIDAKIGKYYVNGNHDTNKNYEPIIKESTFTNLNNKNELIYNEGNIPILLVGLDDYLLHKTDIKEAFNIEGDNTYFTILLSHEPDLIDELRDYNIDLMLSGHSHNGQVRLPFLGAVYTPEGSKKYYDEKYIIDETDLYISGGIGTSTMPFRFLVKPSINFYRLYKK